MRKMGLFVAVLLFCLLLPGSARTQGQSGDPGIKDTVAVDRIDKVEAEEKVVEINVWLWRDEAVDSLVIPLTFWKDKNEDVFCDSVRFGEMVEGDNGFDTNNTTKEISLWAMGVGESHVLPNPREVLATIYFHTGSSWDPDISVPIDTTTSGAYRFKFFQIGASRIEWTPLFLKGALEVRQIPESNGPEDYSLFQNYPNPFNMATTIRFSVPAAGQVNLEIYNILGQRIKTLLENKRMSKGAYEASWDGKDEIGRMSSSGVYFYRLTVSVNNVEKGSISKVGRMVFLK